MFKYYLKCAGSNNMHEHVVHAQHAQQQLACVDVTPVQAFH